jgi:hypothetical protein
MANEAVPTMDESPVEAVEAEGLGYRVGQILGIPLLLGLAVGAVFVMVGLFQGAKIDPGPDPSFIDTIFASRTIVGAARIVVLFGGAYIVASVVVLISRGQFLTKVGPIEVSESVAGITRDRDFLAQQLGAARETIDVLEQHLIETNAGFEETSTTLTQALDYIGTLEAQLAADSRQGDQRDDRN